LDGQVKASGGALVFNPIVPGATTEGDQVAPPSRLTSVKMSKKLLTWYVLPAVRTLVRPSDALVGLSRTITPPGNVPPDRLSDNISVSKNRVLPLSSSDRLLTCTITLPGAENGWKLAPPSIEINPLTVEPKFSVWLPPGGGGG
jgi:hypothetical protein